MRVPKLGLRIYKGVKPYYVDLSHSLNLSRDIDYKALAL